MKFIITLFFLFQMHFLNAQSTNDTTLQVHEITYKISSIADLQDVNWDDIKSVFDKNKPEDTIKIGIELDLPDTKTKLKSSFVVSGQTKNLEDLIQKAKKGTNFLIKIATQEKQ